MPKGVIVHSDRGSQYCSGHYQTLIEKHGLLCSMGAKGNCCDNACAESSFHTFKVEQVHGERFATREAMRRSVIEYIELTQPIPPTPVPTATSARKRWRANWSLSRLSVVSVQDKFTQLGSLTGCGLLWIAGNKRLFFSREKTIDFFWKPSSRIVAQVATSAIFPARCSIPCLDTTSSKGLLRPGEGNPFSVSWYSFGTLRSPQHSAGKSPDNPRCF